MAVIKAYVRRRRPASNSPDMFVTVGPDQFSFPSGHASRAVFIAYFFAFLYPVSIIFSLPLIIWSASICVSRILLRRHHILDVMAGVVLGFVEGLIIGYIWLSRESSTYLLSWLTEEKLEGAEYDI